MRDLLSKLDAIVNETALNPKDPKGDYQAKSQALDDLENDPAASKEPDITKAIDQRRADLEKEAKAAGVFEMGDAFGISISEDFEIGTEIVDFLEDGIVIELDDASLRFLEDSGFTFDEGEIVEGEQHGNSKIYDKCWKGHRKVPGKARGEKGSCKKIGEDQLGEYFYFHKEKDKSAKDRSSDELASRSKKATPTANPEKYKQMAKGQTTKGGWHTAGNNPDQDEKITGPKGKLPEDLDVDEAKYQGREVPLGKKMAGDVKKSKVYVRKPNGNIVKVNFGDKKMRIKKSNPARRKSFRARHNCKNPGPRWKARYWSCRSW